MSSTRIRSRAGISSLLHSGHRCALGHTLAVLRGERGVRGGGWVAWRRPPPSAFGSSPRGGEQGMARDGARLNGSVGYFPANGGGPPTMPAASRACTSVAPRPRSSASTSPLCSPRSGARRIGTWLRESRGAQPSRRILPCSGWSSSWMKPRSSKCGIVEQVVRVEHCPGGYAGLAELLHRLPLGALDRPRGDHVEELVSHTGAAPLGVEARLGCELGAPDRLAERAEVTVVVGDDVEVVIRAVAALDRFAGVEVGRSAQGVAVALRDRVLAEAGDRDARAHEVGHRLLHGDFDLTVPRRSAASGRRRR